jgi:thiol-disulfide isomerase/thioredoxin
MANNLTGDYEAVVQISTRQINGLLATLHQNGADEDAPLKLPHSANTRIGDPPATPEIVRRTDIREWIRDVRIAREFAGMDKLLARLTESAPPGAAKMIKGAFEMAGRVKVPKKAPGTVRGRVKVQLGAPTVTLPGASTSKVMLHVDTRVHYQPDSDTDAVTAPDHPLHGEVEATFEIRRQAGKLVIEPSAQDSEIQFIAAQGTNLTATEVDRISGEVRKLVRDRFTPQPVDLPSGFPFSHFKAVGTGSNQSVALPIQLSGGSLAASHLQSVSNSFIGSSGFAFAVSKQYIETLLTQLTELIKASVGSFKRYVNRTLDVYYTAKVTSGPTLTWKTGAIEFSIGIQLVGHNTLGVNFDITIEQELSVKLKVSTQVVSIKPEGDPELHGSIVIDLIELLGGGIKNAIKSARDEALNGGSNSVNDMVQDTFVDAKSKLVDGLQTFDESASATFTAIEISADGVVVRGDIGGRARHAPVVEFSEIDDGAAYSALQSWIPGGCIKKFTWTWVKNPLGFTWSAKTTSSKEDRHRFVLPGDGTELASICLHIEGTQTADDGEVVNVESSEICLVRDSFGPILEFPFPGWAALTVPLWQLDVNKDELLRKIIRGHISVQGITPRKHNELTHNTLVHFADWQAEQPMQTLTKALAAMKRQKVSLVLIVVLPAGAFDCRRSEAEAKLGGLAERFGARLLVTEDHEGVWAETFAPSKTPSTYLIDAVGRFAWKHEGAGEVAELVMALDQHILPAPSPRSNPLRITKSACGCSKDLLFEDIHGERFALHRLRGRQVLLNFWQPWSAPCMKELERLERLQKQTDKPPPFIAAFHGGKEPKVIQEIATQHGLTFALAHDGSQRIARAYGVRCWPTTIAINADGHVASVQFGATHEHTWKETAESKPSS